MNNEQQPSKQEPWRVYSYRSASAFLGFTDVHTPNLQELVWQRLIASTNANQRAAATLMLKYGFLDDVTVNKKAIEVALAEMSIDVRLNAISIISSRMPEQLDLDAIQALVDISEDQSVNQNVKESVDDILRTVCGNIQWIRMRRVMLASQMLLDGRDRAYAHEFFSTQNGLDIGEIEGLLRDAGWVTQ